MNVRRTLAALTVAALVASPLTACSRNVERTQPRLPICTAYQDEVLDLDDQGLCQERDSRKKMKRKKKPSSLIGTKVVKSSKKISTPRTTTRSASRR